MTLDTLVRERPRIDDRITWGLLSATLVKLLSLLTTPVLLAACEPRADSGGGGRTDAGDAAAEARDAGRDGGAEANNGAGRDGGRGAGADAGPDGGRDARPDGGDMGDDDAGMDCAGGCGPGTPVCDRTNGECVECTRDGHCAANRHCSDEGVCVHCAEDAHCPDPSRSFCWPGNHRCLSCEHHGHCAHLAATPYCNLDIGCVECTPETEAIDCDNQRCDITTAECTSVPVGSRQACQACRADSECAGGLGCVQDTSGKGANAVALGRFCFPRKGSIGCADVERTRRPYSQTIEATTVSGEQATFCLPVASCAAVLDATLQTSCLNASGHDDRLCGMPGVNDIGQCLGSGPAAGKCSYSCINDYDCPLTGFTDCSGSAVGECVP